MNVVGDATKTDIDSCFVQAWALNQQSAVFAAIPYAAADQSVATACVAALDAGGVVDARISSGIVVEGADLTVRFLEQAMEYFQKALYSYYGQYLLARRGYATWARVTNYYASFFSIHSLLCLQGRTVTRLRRGNGSELQCYVIPHDLAAHRYIVCSRGARGRDHAVAWNRYYEIYDRYTSPRAEYELVHKIAHVTDPKDESNYRNEINYVPFGGFKEFNDADARTALLEAYRGAVESKPPGIGVDECVATLHALGTDPAFHYFARVALRLLLASEIMKAFVGVNAAFALEWNARAPIWREFGASAFNDPPANFIETLPTLLT
ncbi:MAG: hypothetical protein HY294_06300 [Candidatus Rokubacteria bacterium]|nr:hypothetical protein [Candidatus Rokubacteria bacterium]